MQCWQSSFSRRWRTKHKEQLATEAEAVSKRVGNHSSDKGMLTLDIEPTNCCNLACIMCARTVLGYDDHGLAGSKRLGIMPMSLYRSIVDQAANLGVLSLRLAWYGEPLLHPRLAEMVSYAKQQRIQDVGLNTNGMLLNQTAGIALLDAGLDRIGFSIDSVDHRQFRRIRVGADLKTVLCNLQEFRRLRDQRSAEHCLIRASMVLMNENRGGVRQFMSVVSKYVDEADVGLYHSFSSDSADSTQADRSDYVCPFLFFSMVVGWDGQAYPCTIDAGRQVVVGDLRTDELAAIWSGKEYRYLRDMHCTHRSRSVAICRQCKFPALLEGARHVRGRVNTP